MFKKKIRFIREFYSATYGRIYLNKTMEIDLKEANNFIDAKLAVVDNGEEYKPEPAKRGRKPKDAECTLA